MHQVIDSAFEKAAAFQRQAVVQKEYTAKLDQTPRTILGSVIRHERKRVVGDAELDDSCQAGIVSGNRIEFVLWDTDAIGTATERGVSLAAFGQALGRDAVCQPTDEITLWKIPFANQLGRTFAQQLVLNVAWKHRIVATPDELGLRLRDKLGRELKKLLGVL